MVAYIGLADAGLQWSIMRELSALHGASDKERFVGELVRAKRVFTGMALVGVVVSVVVLGPALAGASRLWPSAANTSFKLSVAAELLATCAALAIGGYHTTLLASIGRLFATQVAGLATGLVPTGAFILSLVATRSLTVSLFAHAGALSIVVIIRAMHAFWVGSHEARGIVPSPPPTPLRAVLGAGVALKLADLLPAAAFPHVLTVVAAPFVPVAVPARTFVGAGRMVVQQFASLLQVHITRRVAEGGQGARQGLAQYRTAARFLTSIHLLGVGVAGAAAEFVFRLWLPNHPDGVANYLPGMLMEQSLLAAALPSSILFTAAGRLQVYGAIRAGGVALGIAVFVASVNDLGAPAFGYGLAVSAVPHLLIGMYAELGNLDGFPRRDAASAARYVLAIIAALLCIFYRSHTHATSAAIGLAGVVLLPGSALSLWRMSRGVDPTLA